MKDQPLSVHGTSLCAADFRIFFHMTETDNRTQTTVDHLSITKAVGRLFLSVVVSKQLNAVPYLQHKPWQLLSTGRDRASRTQLAISLAESGLCAISRVH